MKIFSKYETSISHCPLSNFFFASKTLNLRRCEKFKVSVGLGTDIAGGYASSILSSIRHAVTANRSMYDLKEDTIDFKHAFWLVRFVFWCDFPSVLIEHFPTTIQATTGGAKALNMSSEFGSFKGLSFDALLIRFPTSAKDSRTCLRQAIFKVKSEDENPN